MKMCSPENILEFHLTESWASQADCERFSVCSAVILSLKYIFKTKNFIVALTQTGFVERLLLFSDLKRRRKVLKTTWRKKTRQLQQIAFKIQNELEKSIETENKYFNSPIFLMLIHTYNGAQLFLESPSQTNPELGLSSVYTVWPIAMCFHNLRSHLNGRSAGHAGTH